MSVVQGYIPLQGAKNLRDFGGYTARDGRRVKKGMLYRSDSLASLTESDIEVVRGLGIQTVCDLRREGEKTRSPSRWYNDAPTVFHHLPFFNEQAVVSTGSIMRDAKALNSADASRDIMINVYRSMVTDTHAVGQIARIFRMLAAHESMPVLLHCSGGKDRTGVASALILTLLGVSAEDVMVDYMYSLDLYSQRVNRGKQSAGQVYDSEKAGELSESALWPVYAVDPDYLNNAFDAIENSHGTVDRFFSEGLRLSDAEIARINALLLD